MAYHLYPVYLIFCPCLENRTHAPFSDQSYMQIEAIYWAKVVLPRTCKTFSVRSLRLSLGNAPRPPPYPPPTRSTMADKRILHSHM